MRGIDIGRKLTLSEVDYLKERGYRFAARYYDGSNGASSKALVNSEISYLHSRGLSVVPVFQRTANYAGYFTYQQGLEDGKLAREDALSAGQPLGTEIYFAVDFDVSDPQVQLVDYFNGVDAGLDGAFTIGVYGEYAVVQHAVENWPGITHIWQTTAWSGLLVYRPADIFQHAGNVTIRPGFVVDINYAPSQPGW